MKVMRKMFIGLLIILIIGVILFYTLDIKTIIMKNIYPKKYENFVEEYSKKYEVDPFIIYSIIKIESNFNEKARSKANAKGLMQLIDTTAIELYIKLGKGNIDLEQLYEPSISIELGTYYFSTILDKYR